MTSKHHNLAFLSMLGLVFGCIMFVCQRLPSVLAVLTVFGKSWTEQHNPINLHSLHLFPMKQKPKGRLHSDAKSVSWICWHSCCWRNYDITIDLSFFSDANLKKSMLQLLLLNVLLPLALLSKRKDVSCGSLWGFCVLVMQLTKYHHDYWKRRQPPIKQT